jgi:histidyl-tRNA synthetase
MLGGGRYDGLVGLFGVPPVPTVGFGWGDVTLINFLSGHNLLPELPPEVDLFIALLQADSIEAQKVIKSLRTSGLNIFTDLSGRKVGDQLRSALKKDIEFFVVIGENELKTERYALKNLKTNKQDEVSLDGLVKKIQNLS